MELPDIFDKIGNRVVELLNGEMAILGRKLESSEVSKIKISVKIAVEEVLIENGTIVPVIEKVPTKKKKK